MSLYTIGDLHLHFGSELKAKNQIEGKVWQNHEEMFRINCEKLMNPRDGVCGLFFEPGGRGQWVILQIRLTVLAEMSMIRAICLTVRPFSLSA